MANKSYTITDGKVYAGIPTSITSDVAAGVWTPTADAYGRILDASWANLPIDEFVAVAGSEIRAIDDRLTAMGLEVSRIRWSVGGLRETFTAWVGIAVDYETGRIFNPRGGGHVDSSINGVWDYNLEYVGGWGVFNAPSDPDLTGYEWVPEYDDTGSFTAYPASDGAGSFYRTALPDGKPTSAHTYSGVWFNGTTRTIETSRGCRWSYSIDDVGSSPVPEFLQFSAADLTGAINHQIFYDPITENVVGYMPRTTIDSSFVAAFPAAGNTVTQLSGYQVKSACFNGRKIHAFGASSEYRTLDVDSLTWDSAGQATTWESTSQADQELVACAYIPQWGKIVRRFGQSGRWILFNPATLENEDWTPAGNAPPSESWIANKYFYYPRRKCLVCISPTDLDLLSVYIMRIE